MRILTPTESTAPLGGRERVQLHVCRELAKRGHSIQLFYGKAGALHPQWISFAQVGTPFPTRRAFKVFRRSPLRSSLTLARTVQAATRLRPDLVYTHARNILTWSAAVGWRSSAPVVVHLHDGARPLDRQDRWAVRRIWKFIAVSNAEAEDWIRVGVPRHKTVVVYNSLDPARFADNMEPDRQASRARLDIPPEATVLAYAGRLEAEKGPDLLIAALRQLLATDPDVTLYATGDPFSDPIDNEELRHALQDSADLPIRWLGFQAATSDLFAAADLVVVPSRADPFPLVPLESMWCGTPVVANRVGGIPEAIPPGLERLLADPENPTSLAATIRDALRWRQNEPELGMICRDHVRRHYAHPKMIDEVESVLVGSHRAFGRASQ